MKKVFIILNETSGESNWTTKFVREIPADKNKEEFAKELAKKQYSNFDEELQDGVYLFNGGCNMVEVLKVEEVTNEEFKVLKKFL